MLLVQHCLFPHKVLLCAVAAALLLKKWTRVVLLKWTLSSFS